MNEVRTMNVEYVRFSIGLSTLEISSASHVMTYIISQMLPWQMGCCPFYIRPVGRSVGAFCPQSFRLLPSLFPSFLLCSLALDLCGGGFQCHRKEVTGGLTLTD